MSNLTEDKPFQEGKMLPGRYVKTALIFAVTLLTLLAWTNRFVEDDAFISFKYAQNLTQGKGLTWNPGERVEGYTNFLWTIMLSPSFLLNIDPVIYSQILGLIIFVISLILTYKFSSLVLPSRNLALLTVILLGSNYTFSSFATSGMETQLQTCMLVAATYAVFRIISDDNWHTGSLIRISLLFSAAILTRLDSSIFVLVLSTVLVFHLLGKNLSAAKKLAHLTWLFVPLSGIVGTWFIWKLIYYGDILPNTYYARSFAPNSLYKGLFYCHEFALSYWLWPFLFLFAAAGKDIIKKSHIEIAASASIVVLWCTYIVRIGGDFMEFRFFVPVLPLMIVIAVYLAFDFVQRRELKFVLVAIILFGSIHHALIFGKALKNTRGIQSISTLKAPMIDKYENWCEAGRVLRKLFHDGRSGVTIATTAAGAIPFYSQLKAVDMCGLNDRWIARKGIIVGNRPGHQKIAPFAYLLDRGANLVIGHPKIQPYDRYYRAAYSIDDLKWFGLEDVTAEKVPSGSRVIEVPLNEKRKLTVLYLVQNPLIDEVIKTYNLKTYEILKKAKSPVKE